MTEPKVKPEPDYLKENRQKIGERIRAFREEKGYSQDELAEIMEVSRSTISKIENGKFAVSIDYLVKFGLHLDFEINLMKKLKTKKSE
jgi:transcriptional regulator with XRE-family HTH domain